MDGLDLLLLEDVAREQRKHQQHNHDKQGPGAVDLLRARFGRICQSRQSERSRPTQTIISGRGYEDAYHRGRCLLPLALEGDVSMRVASREKSRGDIRSRACKASPIS